MPSILERQCVLYLSNACPISKFCVICFRSFWRSVLRALNSRQLCKLATRFGRRKHPGICSCVELGIFSIIECCQLAVHADLRQECVQCGPPCLPPCVSPFASPSTNCNELISVRETARRTAIAGSMKGGGGGRRKSAAPTAQHTTPLRSNPVPHLIGHKAAKKSQFSSSSKCCRQIDRQIVRQAKQHIQKNAPFPQTKKKTAPPQFCRYQPTLHDIGNNLLGIQSKTHLFSFCGS